MRTGNKASAALLAIVIITTAAALASRAGRRPLWTRFFTRCFDRNLLQDGYRAVTVPLDGPQMAHLRTGDRVDVLTTFDSQLATGPQKLSATLLQNVEVVGIDMPAHENAKGGLVLLLNPSEAQYAALAIQQSELSISLRKNGDVDIYPMEMACFVKLFR